MDIWCEDGMGWVSQFQKFVARCGSSYWCLRSFEAGGVYFRY